MKIKVITDTAADLPIEIIKDNNIEIIPHIVSFEDKAFHLGKDISFDEYYKILESIEEIPTTAAPDPASFYEVFEKFVNKQKYDYVFCLTVSCSHQHLKYVAPLIFLVLIALIYLW